MRVPPFLLGCALLGGLLVSCGGVQATPRLIRVPADRPTLQAAVDSARTGDTVLVSPGTYNEAVTVDTDGIVVRGEERNSVILDGRNELSNGFLVSGNNVRIENLTVHSYTQNGVVFNGILAVTDGGAVDQSVTYGTEGHSLEGFEVSHVTSYNNGLYGIYAFASTKGLIEDSYVSGHPDSGIYVGQCRPCDTVVRRITAERNAIGYYGTNASGNVFILESTFAHNRLGIAPNSQKAEKLSPQGEAVVAGNTVADNDDPDAPPISNGFFGGGIAVGGGTRNIILRNLVTGHAFAGIILTALNDFFPENNRVEGNVLRGNTWDLAYSPEGAVGAAGNCFVDNYFSSSAPPDIEKAMPCSGTSTVTGPGDVTMPAAPPKVDYRQTPAPPAQTSMPAITAAQPAGARPFAAPDLSRIEVPAP